MRRRNITLPEQLDERLQGESKRAGISVSEIIRRAVDQYLKREADRGKKDKGE
jgi:metal-responsive CopG/Arc/MetJ family transcriptional regulator